MNRHDVDETQGGRKRFLPGGAWAALIPHHPSGSICWAICEMNPAHLANPILAAVSPTGTETTMAARKVGESEDQSALRQLGLPVERAGYQAKRGERRPGNVEPENQRVARPLETLWENKLQEQRVVGAPSARQEREQRLQLAEVQREQIRGLGGDWKRIGTIPTMTDWDRKELQRSQGTRTACVGSFTANGIANLRHDWKIVCYPAPGTALAGRVAHRGIRCRPTGRCGIDSLPAEWRIHRGRASHARGSQAHSHDPTTQESDVPEVPRGYLAMPQASRILGVSRQTIMQRVKRRELSAVHVRRGKQKGLRIRVLDSQPQLFDPPEAAKV